MRLLAEEESLARPVGDLGEPPGTVVAEDVTSAGIAGERNQLATEIELGIGLRVDLGSLDPTIAGAPVDSDACGSDGEVGGVEDVDIEVHRIVNGVLLQLGHD